MAEKLTYQDFAKRIKEKYPQYKSLDDSTLTAKLLEKYPQYKETVDTGFMNPVKTEEVKTETVKPTNGQSKEEIDLQLSKSSIIPPEEAEKRRISEVTLPESKIADKPKTEQEKQFQLDPYFDTKIDEGDSRYGVSMYGYTKSNIEKGDAVGKHNSIIENINSGKDSTYNAILEDKKKQVQTEVDKLQKQFDFKKPTTDAEVDEYNKKVADFNKQAKSIQEKILSTIDKELDDYVKKTVPEVTEDKFIDKDDKSEIDNMLKNAPEDYEGKKAFIDKIVSGMTYFYDEKQQKEAKKEMYDYLSEKTLFDKQGNPTSYNLKNQAETRLEKVNGRIAEIQSELQAKYPHTKAEIMRGSFPGTSSIPQGSEERKLNEELKYLQIASGKYKEVLQTPDAKEGVKVGKFSDAFTGGAVADILTGGFASAFEAMDLISKIKKGENITDAEKEWLNATSLNNGAKGLVQENLKLWATTGQTISKSLPFITSILMSGGTASLAKAGITKALGWELKRSLKNTLINQLGNAASAASRVPFYGGLYSDLANRRKEVGMKYDPYTGQFTADVKESDKPFVADAAKQFVTTWTEFYAEELGTGIAARVVNPLAKKLGIKGLTNSIFRAVTKATKLNDPVTEYLEEVVTGAMQVAIGEQKSEDFFNLQKQWETLFAVTVMSGAPQILTAPFSTNKEGLEKHFSKKQIAEIDKILSVEDISEKSKLLTQFTYDEKLGETETRALGDFAWKEQKSQVDKIVKEEAKNVEKIAPVIGTMESGDTKTQQEQLDYLVKQGVEIPDGTKPEQLAKLYEDTKKLETQKVNERNTKTEFVKSRGIEISEDISDNELDKVYRQERVTKIKEDNVEFDNQIAESQKRLNLPTTPDIVISDDTELTLDQIDNEEQVPNVFVKKASGELYDRYKELEAMKLSETRTYTTEQIESMQEYLQEEITKLENYANEQAETGEFIGKAKVSETTETGTGEVATEETVNISENKSEKLAESANNISESEKKLPEIKSDLPVDEPTKDLVEPKNSQKVQPGVEGSEQKLSTSEMKPEDIKVGSVVYVYNPKKDNGYKPQPREAHKILSISEEGFILAENLETGEQVPLGDIKQVGGQLAHQTNLYNETSVTNVPPGNNKDVPAIGETGKKDGGKPVSSDGGKKQGKDNAVVQQPKLTEEKATEVQVISELKKEKNVNSDQIFKEQKKQLIDDLLAAEDIMLGGNVVAARAAHQKVLDDKELSKSVDTDAIIEEQYEFTPENLSPESIAKLNDLGIKVVDWNIGSQTIKAFEIDVYKDGTIKVGNIRSAINAINKRFPMRTPEKNVLGNPKTVKGKEKAFQLSSLSEAERLVQAAKNNLEQATKSGLKGMISVMKQNLEDAQSVLDAAKRIDYPRNNKLKQMAADKEFQGIINPQKGKAGIAQLMYDFNLNEEQVYDIIIANRPNELSYATILPLVLADKLRQSNLTVDQKIESIQNEIDKDKRYVSEKKWGKSSSQQREKYSWERSIKEKEKQLDTFKSNKKAIEKVLNPAISENVESTKAAEQPKVAELTPIVEKYGWKVENEKGKIALFNSKDKKVALITNRDGKYLITHPDGTKILSGNKNLAASVEKTMKDYWFAKEVEKKSEQPETKTTPIDKIISASSRFRPKERITFEKPLIGANGAKLLGYEWKYTWDVKDTGDEGVVDVRVSDWTQAEKSVETGRDIVHQFIVQLPDGKIQTVSAESVLVLLGITNKQQMKSFPSLVNAVKTLAKQQMQLALLEAQKKQYDDAYEYYSKADKPEVSTTAPEGSVSARWQKMQEKGEVGSHTRFFMGESYVDQPNKLQGREYVAITEPTKETISDLTDTWVKNQIKAAGLKNPEYNISDLKNRIERQEKKVNEITDSNKQSKGKEDVKEEAKGEGRQEGLLTPTESDITGVKPGDVVDVSKAEYESFDTRGYSYAIVVGDNVVTSGSNPSLAKDPMPISPLLRLAEKYNGKLFIAPTNIQKNEEFGNEQLIMGRTWEQIKAMQQGNKVIDAVKTKMPNGAIEFKPYEAKSELSKQPEVKKSEFITKSKTDNFVIVDRYVFDNNELKDGVNYKLEIYRSGDNKLIQLISEDGKSRIKGKEYIGNGKPQDAVKLMADVEAIDIPKEPNSQMLDIAFNDLKINATEFRKALGFGSWPNDWSGGLGRYTERIREYLKGLPVLDKAISDELIEKWYNESVILKVKGHKTPDSIGLFVHDEKVDAALKYFSKSKEEITPTEEKQITKATSIKPKNLKDEKRQQRFDEIDNELGNELENLAGLIGSIKKLTGEERAKLIPTVTKVAKLLAEKYLLKGQELIDEVISYFKNKNIDLPKDLVDEAIAKIQPKFTEQYPIGTTNAKVRTSREMRGLEAIPKADRIGNEDFWQFIVDKINNGTIIPRQTVIDILNSPEVETNATKEAIVKWDRWRILKETKYTIEEIQSKQQANDSDGLVELFLSKVNLEQELAQNDLAAEKLGAAWGRAGQFRQRNLEEDMSLAAIIREAKILNGGNELSAVQEAQFKVLSDKFEKLQAEYDKLKEQEQARIDKLVAEQLKKREKAEQDLIDEIKSKEPGKPMRDFDSQFKSDIRKQNLSAREKEIKERLRDRLGKLAGLKFAVGEDGSAEIIGELSGVIKDMSELGIVKLEQGIDRIISKVKDYMSSIDKNFDGKNLDKYKDEIKAKLNINKYVDNEYESLINELVEGSLLGFEVAPKGVLAELLRNRIVSGRETIDDVVDDIYESVKDRIDNIDKRMIRDAISGYGEFRKLSKEEVDVKMRELKRQGRLDSAIEDVESDKLPLRTGVERDDVTQDTRQKQARIIKEIKERDLVSPPTEAEQEAKWKSGVETYKRRLDNAIADITKEIKTGERKQKSQPKNYNDEKIESLKIELDRLKKVRTAIDKASGRYDAQREEAIFRATERAVAEIEMDIDKLQRGIPIDKIASAKGKGLFGLSKPAQEKLTSDRIDQLRKLKESLQQQLTDLMPDAIKDKALLDKYRLQRERRLAQLELQKKNKDYGEKPKPYRPPLDRRTIEINREIEKLKFDIEKEKESIRLDNLKGVDLFMEGFLDAWSLPKALVASLDLSAPLRQGIVMVSKPKIFGKAFASMFKYAFSSKAYENWYFDLKTTDDYYEMMDNGMYLAEPHAKLSAKEEHFMSNWIRFIDKFPVYGTLRKGSERAYIGFLNKLRADVYLNYKKQLKDEGFSGEELQTELKSYSKFINTATGRGSLKVSLGKKDIMNLESIAPVLNGVFFSPRLMASRLAPFNPLFWASLSPKTRRQAIKTYLLSTGVILSTLGLLAVAFGDDDEFKIETDPRSSDFMKVRYGNILYDLWGGHQQVVRSLAQFIAGQQKVDGKIEDFEGNRFYGKTSWDVLTNFFMNKLSPTSALLTDLARGGKDFDGNDITIGSAIKRQVVPLYYKDVREAVEEEGLEFVFIAGIPSAFGVSVQTRGKKLSGDEPLTYEQKLKGEDKKNEDEEKTYMEKLQNPE